MKAVIFQFGPMEHISSDEVDVLHKATSSKEEPSPEPEVMLDIGPTYAFY